MLAIEKSLPSYWWLIGAGLIFLVLLFNDFRRWCHERTATPGSSSMTERDEEWIEDQKEYWTRRSGPSSIYQSPETRHLCEVLGIDYEEVIFDPDGVVVSRELHYAEQLRRQMGSPDDPLEEAYGASYLIDQDHPELRMEL